MRRSRCAVALLAAVLVISLTACGSEDKPSDQPVAVESTSSPAPSTPPTSSAPTAAPTQTIGKYGDLSLVLQRPAAVEPKTEPAIQRFLDVHRYFAVMAGGDPAPPELARIANPVAANYLTGILAADKKAKQRAGGTLIVRVTKATASTNVAVVDGCFDQSKVTTIRSNGTRFVDASIGRNPTFKVRVTVSRTAGLWKVSEYKLADGRC